MRWARLHAPTLSRGQRKYSAGRIIDARPHSPETALSTLERLRTALADRYRIERELGAGGMATVYLAEDLKHRRKVALKVLRPELAAIIGAERFLKEIEVTANLQHPNILPLYDSGEADSFLYYVMPYVEGESLRDKLAREKQLGVDDAVALARAVAAALEFAHRHGVVHRDIKPENILLQSGQALVADFGIALAVSQAGGSRMTETGMSLGTPHYMSPEQATGDRTLDARSDVYALGCVTYEMLAGEPPYLGNTAQAIVAKILTETPTPVRKRRASVPVHIEAAIQVALSKLPADRFATAAEFSAALANPGFTIPGTMALAGAAASGGRWKRMALIGFGAAAVLLVALLAVLLRRPASQPHEPVTRFAIALPRDEGLRQQAYARFAISPDGARIAYVSNRAQGGSRLVVRELDQLRATMIPGTESAFSPFFSPDGKSIAFAAGFAAGATALKVVGISGAPPITLADTGISTLGGDWGADGFLYLAGSHGLVRMPATGGSQEALTHLKPDEQAHAWPNLLPGGKAVVFTIVRGVSTQRDIAVLDLQSKRVTPLFRGAFARYAPTGHLAYLREDGALLAVPFDVKRLKVTGAPVALMEGIAVRTFGVADLIFSQTGTLLYASGAAGLEHLVWVTRDGKSTEIEPDWTADFITHALSPDGKRVAVSVLKEGPRDLWIKELEHGPLTRFTFEGAINQRPEWSRDGQMITFVSDRSGKMGLYSQRADGNGTPRMISPTGESRMVAEGFWSPDGKWLIYRTATTEAGNGDILGLKANDSVAVPLAATRFAETSPALSPDGRWLAYASTESGQNEVFVRPFPNVSEGHWQVSVAGGREPVWAHSNHELFYKTADDNMAVATLAPGPGFLVRERKELFPAADYDNDPEHARFNVSPDDQRFLMSRKTTASESDLILVLNWFSELKARMGGKP
ncbi:MAG TPA: protein kinase [Gemmatimonadales bacterium]|nr:protein kinase [Gemmatimonadales bacterium]